LYFIQYEIRPAPTSALFYLAGGAIANCFIQASSPEKAQKLALENFKEQGWEVVSLEDGPFIAPRDNYLDDDEWLQWFDEALQSGACYIFHQWPPEAQDGDQSH
jgi:hypothetical protein